VVTDAQRIAVINGGAGGIGQAVVHRLAADDFLPVILDCNEAACHETLAVLSGAGKTGEMHALDLTQRSAVGQAFKGILERHGRVDALVNLAGGTLHQHLIQDFPVDEWRRVIDVNLKATFLCCQAVIPTMKAQGGGAIVNTASNYGATGSATRTAYSAAKAGIIAFSKSLALELAGLGIRVNTIAPGRTATPRVMSHYTPEQWAESSASIPMGRSGEPTDIAEAVAFLVSDDAAYITGQTLHVNGGMVMP
jgi:NAD(P)-dependent dehydrogenase (short-subunit alcohol dehydrogenase family)